MRVLGLVAIVALLAGCSLGGGNGGATIEADELSELVLKPDDVPQAFSRFDEGRQIAIEQRFDANRLERLGGWKARYRRSGSAASDGPLVVASLVDGFESEDGAKEALAALRSDLGGADLGWRSAATPELGDEALALTADQGSGPSRVTFVVVAWRDANVVATVEANGFAGRLDVDDAVSLARKQATRIERAAS